MCHVTQKIQSWRSSRERKTASLFRNLPDCFARRDHSFCYSIDSTERVSDLSWESSALDQDSDFHVHTCAHVTLLILLSLDQDLIFLRGQVEEKRLEVGEKNDESPRFLAFSTLLLFF